VSALNEHSKVQTKNLSNEYPAIVNELKALMIKYIIDGHSTPGTLQKTIIMLKYLSIIILFVAGS